MPAPELQSIVNSSASLTVMFDRDIAVSGDVINAFTAEADGDELTLYQATAGGDSITFLTNLIGATQIVTLTFDNTDEYVFDDTGVYPAVGFIDELSINESTLSTDPSVDFYVQLRSVRFSNGKAVGEIAISVSPVGRDLIRRFGPLVVDTQVTTQWASLTGDRSTINDGTVISASISGYDPMEAIDALEEWQAVVRDRLAHAILAHRDAASAAEDAGPTTTYSF